MMQMLLRADLSEKLARVRRSIGAPSAEQRAEFVAARAARPKYSARVAGARTAASSDPENYAVVGSVAQICVEGVLSEEPDFWAWLMGCDGTTYKDIRDAYALASADPLVKSVVVDVCSPGGYTDGLFETLAAIERFGNTKPVTVQASEACSAAYALAAMAGPITPKGPASSFGSIGVACSFDFYERIETIDVTSTAAPKKRPDPRTPEGKAVIVEYLDAIHELFADAIARGRTSATGTKYTVAKVNSEFGQGAVMLAEDAYTAGLIDKKPAATKRGGSSAASDLGDEIADRVIPQLQANAPTVSSAQLSAAPQPPTEPQPPPAPAAGAPQPPSPSRGTGPIRTTKMDEAALKAAHPELHALILSKGEAIGHAKGVEAGTKAEHKRCSDHLKLAAISPAAMKVANAAILSGATVIDSHADYLALSLGAHETAARQADSDGAGAVLDGAAPVVAEGGKDLGDQVADRIDALLGKPTKKAS
jgi:ClpP class serine protease